MQRYSLTYIESISQQSFKFKLDNTILEIISEITSLVSAPDYNKTPEFLLEKLKKKNIMLNGYKNFEKTNILKKEGIYKEIDIIRKYINKLTENTSVVISENIINKLDEIKNNYDEKELKFLGETIFEIITNNSLFSDIYALLYLKLKSYDFMEVNIKNKINELLDIYIKIEEIKPENIKTENIKTENIKTENIKTEEIKPENIKIEDRRAQYDKMYERNKLLDKNRAAGLFYTNLMKIEIIEKNTIENLILDTQNLLLESINKENNKTLVDELAELSFILIKNSYKEINTESNWETIKNNIEYLANMNSKNRPSITNKTIFKNMDLVDETGSGDTPVPP